VERLPVLDGEDLLVGIATRRYLLQVFLRPDRKIRDEVIEEVLAGTLRAPAHPGTGAAGRGRRLAAPTVE
jgi:CBS domain-containing protein